MRFLTLFFLGCSIIFSQIQQSGDLQVHINSIINNMPDAVGNNDYVHPQAGDLTTWESIVEDILAANYSDAHTTEQTIDYNVIEYTDNSENPNKVYYVLEKENLGTNYWGTYIFNPNPDRAQLIIQSPHPKKDFNTGKQGFYVFRENGARVFFLAGTSRCNSSSSTSCDGTTKVCNANSADPAVAYKISDQAHTDTGTFQLTTEIIDTDFPNSIFIQLHGFTKLESDPYVIMSNGVINDTPPIGYDFLDILDDNLELQDTSLNYKIAHIDTWDRLAGTTNTQGRFINGSTDPCTTSATINTGRFLHLEQEKTKLRDDETGWAKMSNAIAATFPITPLPVEMTYFEGSLIDEAVLLEWETATEVNNFGFEIERAILNSDFSILNWTKLGFVPGNGTTSSPRDYTFTDSDLPGVDDINYRLKQIDNDGTFVYSKIVTVDLGSITSVDDNAIYEFTLEQNDPNPFNPETSIEYQVARHDIVTLKVFNTLGQQVATLVNELKAPGNHSVKFNGSNFPSGVYFYRLNSGENSSIKKLTLLK